MTDSPNDYNLTNLKHINLNFITLDYGS